jgi:hypothetical protein
MFFLLVMVRSSMPQHMPEAGTADNMGAVACLPQAVSGERWYAPVRAVQLCRNRMCSLYVPPSHIGLQSHSPIATAGIGCIFRVWLLLSIMVCMQVAGFQPAAGCA